MIIKKSDAYRKIRHRIFCSAELECVCATVGFARNYKIIQINPLQPSLMMRSMVSLTLSRASIGIR